MRNGLCRATYKYVALSHFVAFVTLLLDAHTGLGRQVLISSFLTKHVKISRANSWDLPIPYDPEWYEEHYPPPSDSDRSWEQREHFLATYGTHSRFLAGLFLQEIFYIGIERAQNHLRLREWQDEVWQQFNFCDLHISGEFMDR